MNSEQHEYEQAEINPALVQMEVIGGRRVISRIERGIKDHMVTAQIAGLPMPDQGQALRDLLGVRLYMPSEDGKDYTQMYVKCEARITRRQSYYTRRDLGDILRNPQEETTGSVAFQVFHGKTAELLYGGEAWITVQPFDFSRLPTEPGPRLVPYLQMIDPGYDMCPQPTKRTAGYSRGAYRDIVQSEIGKTQNVWAASLHFAMSAPGMTRQAQQAVARIGVCGACHTEGSLRAMDAPEDARIDQRHDIYKAHMKCQRCDGEKGGYVFVATPEYKPRRGDYRDSVMWMPLPRAGWASNGVGVPTAASVEAALRDLRDNGENPVYKPRVDWAPVFDEADEVSRQDAANYEPADDPEAEAEGGDEPKRERPKPTGFKQLSDGWRDVMTRAVRHTALFSAHADDMMTVLSGVKPQAAQNLAERMAPGQALVSRGYRAAPSWRERPAVAMSQTQLNDLTQDLREAVQKHRPDYLSQPVDDEELILFALKLLRQYPALEQHFRDTPGCRVLQALKGGSLAMLEAAKAIVRAMDDDGDIRTEYTLDELAHWLASPAETLSNAAKQRGASLVRDLPTWHDVLVGEVYPAVDERFSRDWMSARHHMEQDHVDMLAAWGRGIVAESEFMKEHGMIRSRVESRGLRSYQTSHRVLRLMPHPDDEIPAELDCVPGYREAWERDLEQSKYIISMLPRDVGAIYLVMEGHSEHDAKQRGCARSIRYVAAVPSLDRDGNPTVRKDTGEPTGAWELLMHRGWWNVEGE